MRRAALNFALLTFFALTPVCFGRVSEADFRLVKAFFDQGILKVTVHEGAPGQTNTFEVSKDPSRVLPPSYSLVTPANEPSKIVHEYCYGSWLERTDIDKIFTTNAAALTSPCEKVKTTFEFKDFRYSYNQLMVAVYRQSHPKSETKFEFAMALIDIIPVVVPFNPPPVTPSQLRGRHITRIATAPDGKIYLLGSNYYTPAVAETHLLECYVMRLLPGLGLDTSFGGDGIVVVNFPTYPNPLVRGARNYQWVGPPIDIEVQSDGKVVVLATLKYSSADSFGIFRLNLNGSIDTSFGDGGFAFAPDPDPIFRHIKFDSSGKILATGDFGITRYTNNGTIDTSFGVAGTRELRNPRGGPYIGMGGYPGSGSSNAVELANGKIIVTAVDYYNVTSPKYYDINPFATTVISSSGARDMAYGSSNGWATWEAVPSNACLRGNGWTTREFIPYIPSPNPKNIIGIQIGANQTTIGQYPYGSGCMPGNYGMTMVQLTASGTLNNSFGTAGKLIIAKSGAQYYLDSSKMGPDGKIYLSGALTLPPPPGFLPRQLPMLMRLTPEGVLEISYGSGTNPTQTALSARYPGMDQNTQGFGDFTFDASGNLVTFSKQVSRENIPNWGWYQVPVFQIIRLKQADGSPL